MKSKPYRIRRRNVLAVTGVLVGGLLAVAPTAAFAATTLSTNLEPNPSFEYNNAAGWTSLGAGFQQVVLANAPDGNYVADVTESYAGSFTLTDSPGPVTSTSLGTTYSASAAVAAASTSQVGRTITISLTESNSAGTVVRQTSSSAVALSNSFSTISVAAPVVAAGDSMHVAITAVGGTSSANFGSFYVDAINLSASQQLPTDNLVATPSFESGLGSFSSGINRTASTVALGNAPDGVSVAEIVANAAGDYSLDNYPGDVTSTAPQTSYPTSVLVAAATSSAVGHSATLTVREHTAAGATVATWTSPAVSLTSSFQKLSVTATPAAGDYLDTYVDGTAQTAGEGIYIDAYSMVAAMGLPAGFSTGQLVMDDRFGDTANYNLLNHWNFGMSDNASSSGGSYWPWDATGTAPYFGSGSGPDSKGANNDAEYWLPSQVSQTSTAANYQSFSSTGNGLTITAIPSPGTYNGGSFTWKSGSINTYGKVAVGGNGTDVYVQMKAQMPSAVVNGARVNNGGWGGLWMLPAPGNSESNSYELDMMESGYTDGTANPLDVVASNLHTQTGNILYPTTTDLSASYHTYGVEMNTATGAVAYYLDGTKYGSYGSGGPEGAMFLALDLQIASAQTSGWHSTIQDNTQSMHLNVSEVQIYQHQ